VEVRAIDIETRSRILTTTGRRSSRQGPAPGYAMSLSEPRRAALRERYAGLAHRRRWFHSVDGAGVGRARHAEVRGQTLCRPRLREPVATTPPEGGVFVALRSSGVSRSGTRLVVDLRAGEVIAELVADHDPACGAAIHDEPQVDLRPEKPDASVVTESFRYHHCVPSPRRPGATRSPYGHGLAHSAPTIRAGTSQSRSCTRSNRWRAHRAAV